MKNFKRFAAIGLAASMVFGSSVVALADDLTTDLPSSPQGVVAGAEQTVDGVATENYLWKKVFKVTVPTTAEAAKVFAFYTDPQGLIAATNAAQVGENVTVGANHGVLFKNVAADGSVSVSEWSDPLTLVNKSTSGVTIGVKARMKEAASGDKYGAGFSTTADFSGSGDATKGMYIGLLTQGEKAVLPLDIKAAGAELTQTNVVGSAYPLYTTAFSGSTYTFTLPEDDETTAALPTFSFYVNGALNTALADTTWYKTTDDEPLTAGAALLMPDIELKYTPTYIDAKPAGAAFDGEALWIYNYDETPFTPGAAVANVLVSGKTCTTAVNKVPEDGYIAIPVSELYTALSLSTDEEKAVVADCLTGVQISVGGVAYYADIQK